LLEDATAACWGSNNRGELGQGDTFNRGDHAGELGAQLPAIDLGEGLKAVSLVAGFHFTCAVLQDATMKCWGAGENGQLGQGGIEPIGDEATEMGELLRPISLGGLRVLQAAVGSSHVCTLLSDDSVRCWGHALWGQLGTGSPNQVGDEEGEMGIALVPAELFALPTLVELEGLRLSGGDGERGWLEVLHNGSWGLICDDGWADSAAQVACRELGMAGGTAVSYTAGNGTIVADNVRCTGAEVRLQDCRFRGWGIHRCSFQEAAGQVGSEGRT
jgi:hypothetical protein